MCVEQNGRLNCRNGPEVNFDPLSAVIVNGTPNIDIQASTSALGMDSDEQHRPTHKTINLSKDV